MLKRSGSSLLSGFSLLLSSVLTGQVTAPVTVEASLDPTELRAGEVITVYVTATSEPEFRIYAINDVAEGPIPSKVTVKGEVVDVVSKTSEPTPINKYDEGFLTETYSHEGTVTFETDVKI